MNNSGGTPDLLGRGGNRYYVSNICDFWCGDCHLNQSNFYGYGATPRGGNNTYVGLLGPDGEIHYCVSNICDFWHDCYHSVLSNFYGYGETPHNVNNAGDRAPYCTRGETRNNVSNNCEIVDFLARGVNLYLNLYSTNNACVTRGVSFYLYSSNCENDDSPQNVNNVYEIMYHGENL